MSSVAYRNRGIPLRRSKKRSERECRRGLSLRRVRRRASQDSPRAIAPSAGCFAQAEFDDEVVGGAGGDAEFLGDKAGVGDRVGENEIDERGKMRVAHFYQKFNNQLADNKFVAGDAFSVADITTIVTVDFGLALTMPIPGSAPHVQRWYDEMQKRPSVRESVTKHAPDGTPLPVAA